MHGGAHQRGINTAIATAFNVPWSHVEKVLPHVDVVLHDHKLTLSDRHRKWTGVDDKRILENIKRACETWPDKFFARTSFIPGVNDDEAHIQAVLAFINPCKNVADYELLPYMRFGESKDWFLGKVYEVQDSNPPCTRIPGPAARHYRRSVRPEWRPDADVTSQIHPETRLRHPNLSSLTPSGPTPSTPVPGGL